MIPNPTIIEKHASGDKYYDLFSKMFDSRIIYLPHHVNTDLATLITGQLLVLEQKNDKEPIHMYINSPGGSVHDGLAIYDVMKLIKSPIYTYCVGFAASMGAFLLQSGDKRFALPHSRIMIHQPSGGFRGDCQDIQIQAQEIQRTKDMLVDMMVESSNMSKEEVLKAIERDNYLTPTEALKLGIIDEIKVRK